MRRCARTRFEPTDWGLKPPIETLPQIAQERAIRNLGMCRKGALGPVGPERGGTIPRTPGTPGTRARRGLREGRLPDQSIGGRALVTRRAVIDIVRGVTL